MPSPQLSASQESDWQIVRRLLGMAWSYRREFLQVVGYQLALLALGLAGIGLTGVGIDYIRWRVQAGAPAPHWPLGIVPPSSWPAMTVVTVLAAGVFGFAALRALLNYLHQVSLNMLAQGKIIVELRGKIYDRLQRLSFRFFDANASSSLINRVTGDAQALRMFVDQVLLQALIMVVSLAAYITFMMAISVKLTVACLAVIPVLWMTSAGFSRIVQPAYRKNRELMDALVLRLVESIRGIRIIKAFGCEAADEARFNEANDRVRDQQRWIFWRVSIFAPGIGLLSQMSIVVLLGYGGYLAARHEISIGMGIVSFAAILQQFSGQISSIAQITNTLHQSLQGARRVFEVLDAPIEIASPAEPRPTRAIAGRFAFESVWFDHGEDPVLQDIDFTVQPGEHIAIVGPTGSGKSALMSLVPRFYDPSAGRILLDGTDLRDYAVEDLRRSIGLVFQENFLFSTSVRDNIAFGSPEASQEQVEKAARIACAHGFIMELPDGYDTVLGESGVGLSGGQRQRLAIARAVLLNPPILLLDDPTASVDPVTEHEIAEAIEQAMQRRTTFIVAHRPAMLQRADRILLLDRGRIAWMGPQKDFRYDTTFLFREGRS